MFLRNYVEFKIWVILYLFFGIMGFHPAQSMQELRLVIHLLVEPASGLTSDCPDGKKSQNCLPRHRADANSQSNPLAFQLQSQFCLPLFQYKLYFEGQKYAL